MVRQKNQDMSANRGVKGAGKAACLAILPIFLSACGGGTSSMSTGPVQLNETTSGMALTLTPEQVNKSIYSLSQEREARQGIAGRLSGN